MWLVVVAVCSLMGDRVSNEVVFILVMGVMKIRVGNMGGRKRMVKATSITTSFSNVGK